ncbi:MAG TPA: T9SS type A sorting domain-containing protein [Ignavibacteriaceae bacterium]|nr:T9SS type A sorting domain-containing protein [Ignavibacteriaceae bacterium]
MKSIYKIFLLALGVYTSAISQIAEITRLPVQDISQSIKESAPVWLSENEIMIFYVNQTQDTIFSAKSTNRGSSWQHPDVTQVINLLTNQELLHLAALRTSSGRVLLAWTVLSESMKLIHSDDKGENWSQPISILGGGAHPTYQKSSSYLNITEWQNNELCLSFYSADGRSYYKLSVDDGLTWSANPLEFPHSPQYRTQELTIITLEQNTMLGVYESSVIDFSGIYYRVSTDYGLNWSNQFVIADEIYHERRPKVSKLENGNIIVIYQRDKVKVATSYGEKDIYFKVSSDNGSSWSEENQFTKYIGEDLTLNLSTLQNKTFVTFATERYSLIDPLETPFQVAYGILQESDDKFTPPKVYHAYAPQELIDYVKKEFVYRVTAIDDEAVKSVIVSMEDSAYIVEVFDDGMHNDGEANDSVFANTFPFINPRYLNGHTFNVNKIYLPLNNAGVLADVNVSYGQKATIVSADNIGNESVYKRDVSLGGQGSLGQYDGGGFLFSAGFFLSGYVSENLFVNGVASSTLVEVYQPGVVGSDPKDMINTLYVVNKNDPPFGNSWQNWKNAVLLGADFYDGDIDGHYNPVDKNFNGTWDLNEDMPPLIGDEIAWCVYNDGMPADQRRFGFKVDPVGVEVRQTLFASNNSELENVIFIKYKLSNTGLVSDELDSVFFSPWDDTDIGDATDDLGGCDTLLNSIFTYNSPVDAFYGNNPPAVYTSVLQGPVVESTTVTDTAFIRNGRLLGEQSIPGFKNLGLFSFTGYAKGSLNQGDPRDSAQVWNYVFGRERDGNLLNPCDSAWGYVYGNINCNDINPLYWFSGDPVNKIGWLDIQARDDRKFSSIGPLQLEKNKPVEIILALIVGRGADNLNSITVAREIVQRAIQEYQSNFASMTYTPPAPTNPVNSYVLYQNYPNPFNPTTTIRYELPQDGVVTIEVFDILGQKVKTLLNEFQKADRYEVTFNSAGLASGVYIYQIRVNDFITSKKMVLIR